MLTLHAPKEGEILDAEGATVSQRAQKDIQVNAKIKNQFLPFSA
jgi:hypothetical protein